MDLRSLSKSTALLLLMVKGNEVSHWAERANNPQSMMSSKNLQKELIVFRSSNSLDFESCSNRISFNNGRTKEFNKKGVTEKIGKGSDDGPTTGSPPF